MYRGEHITYRTTITVPEELKAKLDVYNSLNPYRKINVSKIAQDALNNVLKEVSI